MSDMRPITKLTQTFCHSTTEKLSGTFIPTSLTQENAPQMSQGLSSVQNDALQEKKPDLNSQESDEKTDEDTLIIVD